MGHPLSLRIATTTLTAVMAITLVACSQQADTTGTAAPAITVGTQIDDSVVTTRVKAAMLDHIDIKGTDIAVETRKGEVMLSGFVANQSQIDQALTVAQGVEGVTSVNNKLAIKDGVAATVGTKIDDGVITTQVKAALLADASINGLDINVATRKGEVQLSGFVNNQGQIDRAVAVARTIDGVTQVTNQMSLKK